MNALIYLNGTDITDSCRLQATRINYDSSRRITTASVTIMGRTLSGISRYDSAHYDIDTYSVDIGELYLCTILDGRDGVTKLFEGRIFSLGMEQSDTPSFEIFYKAELNDHASALDRSVCWGGYTLALPASDRQIIQSLLGHFCPQINSAADVAEVIPVIQWYDWKNKTARQVLDDMTGLAGAEWTVDFDGVLHYRLAADAPAAPFALSTSPDHVTSFPVKVSGYKRDFSNPINKCYVRGAPFDPASGLWIEAEYADPVSIERYGELQATVIDDQIATGWDAAMRAKSVVLKYNNPIESGSFTIWAKDGLKLGQQVSITEDALGLSGWYIIRSLTMQWFSKDEVQYDAQFGASKPDLEALLRQLDQRSRWKTTNLPPSLPGAGSITDANIKVPPGLSAGVIGSVNAGTIIGQIQAGQIGSVNAASIAGVIQAGQIGSVNATTIAGAIQAGQIGSVNAAVINGVIISSQLADQIISDLAKYADALRPVQIVKIGDPWGPVGGMPNKNFPPNSFFYFEPDGNFYQVTPDGMTWVPNNNPKNSLMSFYQIGRISANSITGLILAAQIQTITAGQITGSIQAGQIGTVNASAIAGLISASQIGSVNASVIQGAISSTQITSISADKITGSITSGQIGSINAATITIGLIADGQIGTISGSKLIVGSVSTDKLSTTSIDVGGGGSKPGVIKVYNATEVIGEIGLMTGSIYGGWFKVFGAGGTDYASAKVYTNTAGSLFIRDADLSIASTSSGTIATSTTTFDTTYASIALKITKGTEIASLVSRGLIVYDEGSKIGSLVRSPTASYLELECGSGSNYVLISGNNGIRSDKGYRVGSNTGKTMNITFRDAAGNIMRLWADGVDRGQVSLEVKGGIITGP
jgi:hypothetical protein